jgi:hypothetical protein
VFAQLHAKLYSWGGPFAEAWIEALPNLPELGASQARAFSSPLFSNVSTMAQRSIESLGRFSEVSPERVLAFAEDSIEQGAATAR